MMKFFRRRSAVTPPPPQVSCEMLESRRLLSTSLAYTYSAANAAGDTPAAGVSAAWVNAAGSAVAAPAGDGSTLTLSDLAPHQMVYVDVDLADAGATLGVETAGRTSQRGAAPAGTDGWIADDDGTLTVTLAGDAALKSLHVYTYQPTLSVTGDDAVYADGDAPAVKTLVRDLPAPFNGVVTSEPTAALTLNVADNGGTAQPGVDYALSSRTLTMPAGSDKTTILINPIDGQVTRAKTIDLVFLADDAVLADASTILIQANDAKPGSINHANPTAPGASAGNPLKPSPSGAYEYKSLEAHEFAGGAGPTIATTDFSYKLVNAAGVALPPPLPIFNVVPKLTGGRTTNSIGFTITFAAPLPAGFAGTVLRIQVTPNKAKPGLVPAIIYVQL